MKKIFLFLVCAASITAIRAQEKQPIQLAAGVNIGIPVGNFSKSHSFGFGFEGQGEYMVAEKVGLIGSLGYTHFLGKNLDGYYYDYKVKGVGVIPILAGARYYSTEQVFVGGKLGLGVFTGGGSGTGFNFAPQVGYNTDKFQAVLAFNLLSQEGGNASFLGLSGVYKFASKK